MEIISHHHVGQTLFILTRAALALLFLGTIVAQILAIITGQTMVSAYPEFADIHIPLVVAAILFGVCVEIILVVTAILVGYIRNGRIFSPSSLRLVSILTAGLSIGTIIIMLTLFFIPGPPALGLLLVGTALVGISLTLVVLVLRSLLYRAVFMRAELDEVV